MRLPLFCVRVFCLLLLGAVARGQGGISHVAWSTEEGLPQNSVHQILQSRDGYIWIATEAGVARFDGTLFKVFRHENDAAFTSDDVCCMVQDRRGALWFGTADGLVRYAGGQLKHLPVTSQILSLAAAGDGSLLMLTSDGLMRLADEKGTLLPLPAGMHALTIGVAVDESAFVISNSGLLRYSDGALVVQQRGSFDDVVSAAIDGKGALWLRTSASVRMSLGGVIKSWACGRELPGTRTESLTVVPSGEALVGTNRGLAALRAIDGSVETFADLNNTTVLSTMVDREGVRWIGTETAGLHALRPRKFRSEPGLADQAITAVVEDTNNTVWLGARDDGMRRVRAGKMDAPFAASALTSPVVLSLAAGRHGDLWVGTPDGLNHVDGARVDRFTSEIGLPDDFVRSLLVDEDDSVWAGTRRGLAHWKNGKVTVLTRADGLGSDLIGTMLQSHLGKHDLWVGTLGGLSRIHGGKIATFTRTNGLAGNVVTALAEEKDGTLWVGTREDGLSRSAGDDFTALRQQALPRDIVALHADAKGYLWIRSKRGVARVAIAELNRCGGNAGCSLAVSHYGYEDGMPSEEAPAVGHPAAWAMRNGELWFATRKGVAIVDANHVPENGIAPPVMLEHFVVDDTDVSADGGDGRDALKLGPGHARFAFEYVGLSFPAPGKVRYRYRLEGFDKDWVAAGARRTAYYTNLPAGTYRFHVVAANNDGVWNETGAAIAFSIAPPFYRRWWFYALVLLLLGGAGYVLYRMHLRRLQREFDAVLGERNRIAREIHDTLAQDFVGVSLQLEIAAQMLGRQSVDAAKEQIDRARTLVREGIADARQSIWDLRATTAQEALPARLRQLVERAGREGLAVRLDVGGAYRALLPKTEAEILRIVQEALANVVRHARATEAHVEVRYSSDMLVLRIEDDGRGFDVMAERSGHYGVQGMRERAKMIGAELTVESTVGGGTRVLLRVPAAAGERS